MTPCDYRKFIANCNARFIEQINRDLICMFLKYHPLCGHVRSFPESILIHFDKCKDNDSRIDPLMYFINGMNNYDIYHNEDKKVFLNYELRHFRNFISSYLEYRGYQPVWLSSDGNIFDCF